LPPFVRGVAGVILGLALRHKGTCQRIPIALRWGLVQNQRIAGRLPALIGPREAISIASRTDDGRDATGTPKPDADGGACEGEVADVALDRDVAEKVLPAAA
jgi:hypothetical protein